MIKFTDQDFPKLIHPQIKYLILNPRVRGKRNWRKSLWYHQVHMVRDVYEPWSYKSSLLQKMILQCVHGNTYSNFFSAIFRSDMTMEVRQFMEESYDFSTYKFTRIMAEKMFGLHNTGYSLFIGTRLFVIGTNSKKFNEFFSSESIRWLPPSVIVVDDDDDEDENGNKKKKTKEQEEAEARRLELAKVDVRNFWNSDVWIGVNYKSYRFDVWQKFLDRLISENEILLFKQNISLYTIYSVLFNYHFKLYIVLSQIFGPSYFIINMYDISKKFDVSFEEENQDFFDENNLILSYNKNANNKSIGERY